MKSIDRLIILGLALLVLTGVLQAQDKTSVPGPTEAPRTIASLLSTLPEADTLIYINPQRILNEAVPKLMPEADVAKMRQHFDDLKQFAGVDPSQIEYIVLVVRSRKPPADLSFQLPEFLIVTRGAFSSESLMTLARLGLQSKLREEKYGAKTLAVVTIDELMQEAERNPILRPFTQIGLASLDNNTIAAGNVAYLKAALDSAEGHERISQETLNSLLRDPNALVSIAGSPWNSFAKSFGLMGTETNPRPPRCDSKLGDFYAAVTMEGQNFKLRGSMNADNPDTAKIINSLISGLLQTAATAAAADKPAQAIVKTLSIRPQDDELRLEADIPHQMVLDYIHEQMRPKPPVAVKATAPTTKPVKKLRRRTKR